MGSKLTKAKKKDQEEEQKTVPVDKDWSTSTWPRKKKPDMSDFKEEKSGTLGRRSKFGKGSTATLGNDSKLERKPSFGKRIRASARNWASTKGLYKGNQNQQEGEAETKPSSVILAKEEEKEAEVIIITPVENEVPTSSSELDVGALVKELVTQKLKKSKEKIEEKEEIKVEAQVEDVPVQIDNEKIQDKIFPGFVLIDSNTAVTTEFYPAENVSQSVCEEDVTAIELIEPGDEIVIATESIVEENENSYIEEKIEVIDSSAENMPETVCEETVPGIDYMECIDKISMATETVVEENENAYTEERVEVIENCETSNDDNIDHPEISVVSSSELLENTGDKETPETSFKAQHAFEINEVPTEVQMKTGENMDSTTPEISHIKEIEEAGTIPVEIKLEDDTNAVDIEDISIIVEDNLENEEKIVFTENENESIDDKNNVQEHLDLTEHNEEIKDDILTANKSDELTKFASVSEMEVSSNEKIEIELNENAIKIDTIKEEKDSDITVHEDEEEKEKENIVEKSLPRINNQQELKYITEEEEDDSLETAEEIESFEINEQVHEVTFEGSEEFIEFEDQSTKESLTQYEETPILETVEEMEEPPMEESERVVLCENEISTEEVEEAVSHVVKSEEINNEKESLKEPIKIEQHAVLETEIDETLIEEMVDGFVVMSEEYQDENMSVDEIELSRQVTMEIKETEESGDSMSYEDNFDVQEELVLSEAEEIAQNILDKVFSEITDSAYFEGDDLECVMEDQEEVSEEFIETVREENSPNEVSKEKDIYLDEIREEHFEIDNSQKQEANNESSGVTEEHVVLVDDVLQDDSSLFQVDVQTNNHDALESVEEIEEVKQSNEKLTLSLEKEEKLMCYNGEVICVEKSEECCQEQDIEKDFKYHVGEDGSDCNDHIDQENELLTQAMQDLSGKLGNTLKLVQEHILVTSDDIVEMEKSKTSDSEFSTFTNTNIEYEVSEDGSDGERTDVSTDEGIVASSDEDEKCHGAKDAKEKLSKNKEDVKNSLDNGLSEFK